MPQLSVTKTKSSFRNRLSTRISISNKKPLRFLAYFSIAFLVTFTVALAPVYSDEVTDLEKKIDQTEEQIKQTEEILAKTQASINGILASNLTIDQKIAAMEAEIAKVDVQINTSQEELTQKEADLKVKEDEANLKLEKIKEVSQNLYKDSRVTLVEILLSKDKSSDFFKSYMFKKYTVTSQTSALKSLNDDKEFLDAEKKLISEKKANIESEKAALVASKTQLDQEKAKILASLYAQTAYKKNLSGNLTNLTSQLNSLSGQLQNAIIAKAGSGGDQSGGGNSSGGTSPQPPSGNAGSYDIYTDCRIENNQYVGCNLLSANVPGPVRVLGNGAQNVFEVELWLKYRGVLEFRADSNVYMVNELPFEHYLLGIGEVPSSWPSEALKAQAVAARTYAAKNWNKRSGNLYNLRDDTYDQNYVGYNKESEAVYGTRWVSAVTGTSGDVIYSGNSLISAYYHSTCGGHTLNSEEVWVSALPYAKAESDFYQNSSGAWVSYDAASPWSYKKWGTGTINDAQMADLANAALYLSVDVGSQTRQNNIVSFTEQQIRDALGAGNTIQDRVGTITNVQSVYTNGQTYITGDAKQTDRVRITGTNGTVEIERYPFWLVFNSRSPGTLTLYWSWFWTSVKEGDSWNFYLRGYPHRVGMCQYGAYGRAQVGQTYDQILGHYYRGTHLEEFGAGSPFRVGITRLTDADTFITSKVGDTYQVYGNGDLVGNIAPNQSLRVVKK